MGKYHVFGRSQSARLATLVTQIGGAGSLSGVILANHFVPFGLFTNFLAIRCMLSSFITGISSPLTDESPKDLRITIRPCPWSTITGQQAFLGIENVGIRLLLVWLFDNKQSYVSQQMLK